VNVRPAFVRCQLMSRFHRRPAQMGTRGPIVTFTFDDFPRTAYSVGGAILEELGVRGTYYAAPSLMNSADHLGDHFRLDDILGLIEKGHELGSHTFGHTSCHSVSVAEFRADVDRGCDALLEMTGKQPTSFAYPFGDVSLEVKKEVGPAVASSRGICPGFNGPSIDLNLLRANRLYGGSDNLHQVQELISENVRRKSWLIFFAHDVRPQHSPYGCTPQLMQSAAEFALNRGARILTVQDALADLGIVAVDRNHTASLAVPDLINHVD
jgi:peptidoglycan/xylan/chitin deacetylase (PgdA/CDA1 family)